MADPSPRLSTESPRRALAIAPGLLCVSLWSWGWLGAEPQMPAGGGSGIGGSAAGGVAAAGSSSASPSSPSPLVESQKTPEVVESLPRTRANSFGPTLTPELHVLRLAAQQRILGPRGPGGTQALAYATLESVYSTVCDAGCSASDFSATSPKTLALGHFLPIEQEFALTSFHRALNQLLSGKDDDAKVRILAYGASHTQADSYPGYLRAYLQARFGDGGRGFVALGRINDWYRPLDMKVRHQSFVVHHARQPKGLGIEPLGLMGAALIGASQRSFGEVLIPEESLNTRFEVQYFSQPGGGDFEVILDGRRLFEVQTQSVSAGFAYRAFEATPGAHRIRVQLRGNGSVRLFGLVAETSAPGVVVDTLGLGGSRISGNLQWDEQTWIDSMRHRSPDLVTFAYGTNEAADKSLKLDRYERELREVLFRTRKALPLAGCLLIAPFDGPARMRERLVQIGAIQRRVAREVGCGFWDAQSFMGGSGSIGRWAATKPPLAAKDRIHLTRVGYVYAGIAIGDALMRAYDQGRSQSSAASVDFASSNPARPGRSESSGSGAPSMRLR